MTRRHSSKPPALGWHVPAAVVRLGVRQLGRRVLSPRLAWDVQRRRLAMLDKAAILPKGTAVGDIALNGVRADVVTAPGIHPERTVVHFHGGGYCVGGTGTARAWAAHLSAQAQCRVVLPDYRLAPEHPHPAALDDARGAMKSLLAETDPAAVVVCGDSAGGGLALSLLVAMRDAGDRLPAGCVLLSPWLDLAADRRAVPGPVRHDLMLTPDWLEACAAAYAGGADLADPAISPLHAAHGGLPPLLIQAGTDEVLAPDAERLAASASAAGVDVTFTSFPRMWHDFTLQPGLLAAADSAMAQAAWFVRTVTG